MRLVMACCRAPLRVRACWTLPLTEAKVAAATKNGWPSSPCPSRTVADGVRSSWACMETMLGARAGLAATAAMAACRTGAQTSAAAVSKSTVRRAATSRLPRAIRRAASTATAALRVPWATLRWSVLRKASASIRAKDASSVEPSEREVGM